MPQAKPPLPTDPLQDALSLTPAERTEPDLRTQDDRDGWREFDADASWQSDRPYPAESTAPQPETATEATGDQPDDLLAAALEALGAVDGLDTTALSVERAGETIILRGTATSEADARRAEEAVLRIAGVGRVDNLLDAG